MLIRQNKIFLHLNDQHVLSEVIPLFKDNAHRCSRDGRWHGTELQPQWLLLGGHHLAFVKLHERYEESQCVSATATQSTSCYFLLMIVILLRLIIYMIHDTHPHVLKKENSS